MILEAIPRKIVPLHSSTFKLWRRFLSAIQGPHKMRHSRLQFLIPTFVPLSLWWPQIKTQLLPCPRHICMQMVGHLPNILMLNNKVYLHHLNMQNNCFNMRIKRSKNNSLLSDEISCAAMSIYIVFLFTCHACISVL